jgi:ATP-dependent Clp endopeptidase proteolytic subunit ClpP
MRRNWYDIKAAAGNTPAVISIYDEIGMWGITAKEFIASFNSIKDQNVELHLNTPGGSVFDGLAMFNAMKNSGKNITVRVMGIAASMGSYLAMVGNKIIMAENTFLMVHSPLNGLYGNAADMREMADILDKIGNTLASTYVARSGQSPEEVAALLSKDTYLTAAECLALGFCDEVSPAITATAKFEHEHLPAHIQALFNPVASGGDDPEDPDAIAAAAAAKAEADAALAAEAAVAAELAAAAATAVPFADQVVALATAAGFEAHAAVMALDAKLDTIEKVTARLAEAREINALCLVAKRPDDAAAFINQGKTLTEARTALCDALATAADIDTAKLSSDKPIRGAQPSASKTSDIWAAHRNNRSKA